MADESPEIHFGASIEGVLESIEELKEKLSSILGPIGGLKAAFKELAEIAAAAFAVEEIKQFFEKYAELGEQVTRTGYQLGVSAKQAQELGFISEATGGSAQSLTMSMSRFELMLQRAQNSTSMQGRALQALGLSAKELIGVPIDKQLELVADSFQKLHEKGINPSSAAMSLFGRAGFQLIPMLIGGKHGLEELKEAFEETGGDVLPKNIELLAGLKRQGVETGTSFQNLGATIAAQFAPAMAGLIRVFETWAAAIKKSIDEGGLFKILIEALVVPIQALAIGFAVATAAVQTLWTEIKLGLDTIGVSFMAFGRAVYDVFTGNFGDLKSAWHDFTEGLHKNFETAAHDMEKTVESMVKTIKVTLQGGASEAAPKGGETPLRIPIPDAEAIRNAQQVAEQIKKVQELLYKGEEERLSTGVKLFQYSNDQKTALLLSALDHRDVIEVAALNEELIRFQTAGATPTQIKKIQDQITDIYLKSANERAKIRDQALETDLKEWESIGNSIQSAWDSQLKGLLGRTISWATAMKNITADLTIKMIEYFEKIAIERAALGLANMFGGGPQSLVTTILSPNTAANTTALAVLTASVDALNVTMGGQIAATTVNTGSLLTTGISWVANTAATIVNTIATDAAAIAHFFGFQSGSWEVPRTMLAAVHQGEMIIPAEGGFAESMRGMIQGGGSFGGGGGGSQINMHLSAFNPSGLQELIKHMMPQLARELSSHVKLNPSAQ